MDSVYEAFGATRPAGDRPTAVRRIASTLGPELARSGTSAAHGDATANAGATTVELEAAIERWGDTVLRLAASRMGSLSDAEDVFQTVFLRLLQSDARFADSEHLKAWLLRVTVNCCNDAHRSPWRKRRAAFDEDAVTSLPEPDGQDAEDPREAGLEDALGRLTIKQRTAIHLHYYEGCSTDEIARITGERPSTVRSHLYRARKALRIDLGAQS